MAKTHKSQKATKFDCDKFNNVAVKMNYQKQIREKILTCNFDKSDDPDLVWGNIKECVTRSAKEVLGEAKPEYRPNWFDAECEAVTNKKNEARSRLHQTGTRRATEEYKKRRRIEKRVHKQKKKQSELSQVEELNQLYARNINRKFYRRVNQQRKEFKPRTVAVRDKSGLIVNDKPDILARWKEHFDELLNTNNNIQQQLPETSYNLCSGTNDDDDDELSPPNINDTRLALQGLKNNKSPGSDGIPSELLKYGGKQLHEAIHKLVTNIWDREKMPEEWNLGLLCPLHKKGDALVCSNYRGVTLLNTCYKVLSTIIFHRLLPYAEKIIGEYQCGFRPNRSTIDQIFSLRQILEKMLEFNLPTHHIFIDFKAAYDSITGKYLGCSIG